MSTKRGFFTPSQPSKARMTRAPTCISCGLHAKAITPKMEPHGDGRRGILVLAEAPGKSEDEEGKQLIGKAGQRLRKELAGLGVDLDRDCLKTNSVTCRPPDNRTPTAMEIDACRKNLIHTIEEFRPKVILALGGSATDALYGHRWPERASNITQWRGWSIPDQVYGCWVVPTFHPSYLLRVEDKKDGSGRVVGVLFRQDIEKALNLLNTPVPMRQGREEDRVTILTQSDAASLLRRAALESPKLFAFDYETTGLKPYNEGHRIRSCSVSWEVGRAYSFIVDDGTGVPDDVGSGLVSVLRHPGIGKTAHSLKYESKWSRWILGVEVTPWAWDTMEVAHIQDDRKGVSGLKFQAFTRLGVPYWASEVESLLKAPHANDFNKVYQIPQEPLLRYGGFDSLYQYEVAIMQMKEWGVTTWL